MPEYVILLVPSTFSKNDRHGTSGSNQQTTVFFVMLSMVGGKCHIGIPSGP